MEPRTSPTLTTVRRGDEVFDPVADLAERRAAAADRPDLVGRRRLLDLVDSGSFVELGTFTQVGDDPSAVGDGLVGGQATIGGRGVVVAADEPAVHGATSGRARNERLDRLMTLAIRKGVPFAYLADGGALRPDEAAGAEGLAELGAFLPFATRCRQVPMITAVLGDTTEASALVASFGDVVVQVAEARYSLAAEPVPGADEPATGSAERNARTSGIVDVVVDTEADALETVRRVLDLLPPNQWTAAERRGDSTERPVPDPSITEVVPRRRTRAYDVRRLVERIVDPRVGADGDAPGELLELRPAIGRGLVTGLARIDGRAVGIFASNPMYQAGAMDPAACEKGIRLLTLCDAFQLPAVFLQDVAGFLVGRQVEHGRMLFRAVRFLNALYACSAPTLTVVVRKAYGLAYEALNGRKYHTDGLYAWPGAELGFMDPAVGVNVLYGDRKSTAEKAAIVAELNESNAPYGAAADMNIDEIIDPATTRQVLARDLALLAGRQPVPVPERVLSRWPTC
jgi:acetyl-CoA carboxylase carboxyltransferase component